MRVRLGPRAAGVVAAAVLLAGGAGVAPALPGDAPFAPSAPAPGAVVPPDPDGIPVTFDCPVYRISDAGGGFAVFGGPTSYGVDMATSPATGPDGRLVSTVAGVSGVSSSSPVCAFRLGAGGSSPLPQETPGTYWWQVWRLCTGCPGSYEVGPVQQFTIRSPAVPRVGTARAFAGYPVVLPLTLAGVPDGTVVQVQRRAGSRFVTAGTATALGGAGEAVVTLPRGRVTVRAAATIGSQAVTGPARTLTVRPAAAPRTTRASDDGAYAGAGPGRRTASLRVSGAGRLVRSVRAYVPMLCPGITPGTFTTQIGTLRIASVRVAPDGAFVRAAVVVGDTSQRVRGRLSGRRVTGRVELSLGDCVGNASFTVRRTGP